MSNEILEQDFPEKPKPNVQRRLEFIEFRLLWNGRFNRKDLSEIFQISSQQASADIAIYERLAPGNSKYDNAIKAYLRTDNFKPNFINDLADRYLLQMVAICNDWINIDDTWFETLPHLEVVTLKRRKTDSLLLMRILDAIRDKLELDVDYRSINSPEGLRRWIAPHALAYNSGRWYLRAWSRERNDFRDFNLNRIINIHSQQAASVDVNLDYEWNNYIDLQLTPNPNLSQETQSAVAEEYDIIDGCIVKNIRLSQVFYFMNEYNLDIELDKIDPKKQQLILLNRDEVKTAQIVARKMSMEALKRAQQT